jgi:hypothetical protein
MLVWLVKTAALWIGAVAGCIAAGLVVHINLPPPLADGPLTSAEAMLVVNGLVALSLSLVATIARVRGVRLAVLLFVSYFVIASAMMQIETLWFNESLKLPLVEIGHLVIASAVMAAVTAIIGALLFHPAAVEASPVPATIGRRIAIMAVVYVVLYYGAGSLIAWQSAAVRAYYENGIHIAFLPTVLFQIFRGTLWAIIALFIGSRLSGSLARRAGVMGLLFAVMTAAQLLYPTSFFPWPVRAAHLMEVGASEFAYGVIATFVLLAGAAKRPLENSIWRRIAGQA